MSDNILLKVSEVTKSYSIPPSKVEVLKGVSFEVTAGDMVAISGPSGSGKTTLLNLIGTLDSADGGSIYFDNTNIANMTEEECSQFRLNRIGLVFQRHHLLPQCTALENVILPTVPTKQSRLDVINHAKKLFEQAGLTDRMNHFPGQLSGGERQRVAVIRALINKPDLLLADEPTGALDKSATNQLLALLKEFNHDGMTIVMVTHSVSAASYMNKQFLLDDGILLGID